MKIRLKHLEINKTGGLQDNPLQKSRDRRWPSIYQSRKFTCPLKKNDWLFFV